MIYHREHFPLLILLFKKNSWDFDEIACEVCQNMVTFI